MGPPYLLQQRCHLRLRQLHQRDEQRDDWRQPTPLWSKQSQRQSKEFLSLDFRKQSRRPQARTEPVELPNERSHHNQIRWQYQAEGWPQYQEHNQDGQQQRRPHRLKHPSSSSMFLKLSNNSMIINI